ncbi:hypothetical protein, partial [Paucibacter soli]|uniref:hypothetical protein n=1 Tax=Paucibacter soli TaxID=3133433 RepID=UPI0030A1083B
GSKSMLRTAVLLALFPSVSIAQAISPCSFVVGHGLLRGDPSQGMQAINPAWFTASGRAEVEIRGKTLQAKFFDSASPSEPSHNFKASFPSVPRAGKANTKIGRATLRTIGTDGGDDELSGEIAISLVQDASGKFTHYSLVAHDAHSFVGITCFAKRAA